MKWEDIKVGNIYRLNWQKNEFTDNPIPMESISEAYLHEGEKVFRDLEISGGYTLDEVWTFMDLSLPGDFDCVLLSKDEYPEYYL
jgi:hypothetical protein